MSSPTVNVASALAEFAADEPHRLAVLAPHGRDGFGRSAHTHLTFRQLDEDSNHLAVGLHEIGIHRGTRAVLMVTPGLDFFSLTFALFKVAPSP